MSQAGDRQKWDTWRGYVTCTASTSGSTNTEIANAFLVTEWVDSPTHAPTLGVSIGAVVEDRAGTSYNIWSVDIDAYGISWSSTATGTGGHSTQVEIDAVNLYCIGVQWWAQAGEVRIYKNGALNTTYALSIAATQPHMTPAGWPLFGMSQLRSSAGFNPTYAEMVNGGSPPAVPVDSVSVDCTATGGWMHKVDGTWQTRPIAMLTPAFGEAAGGCGSPTQPNVSATNCGTATATSHNYFSADGVDGTWDFGSATLDLIPNDSYEIKRVDPTIYGALWERKALPSADAHEFSSCVTTGTECTAFVQSFTTHIPEAPWAIARVLGSAHSIEDPLGYETYAPYVIGGTYYSWNTDTGCGTFQTAAYPKLDKGNTLTDYIPDLWHVLDRVWYYQTWGARLWHYVLAMPSDNHTGGLKAEEWPVYGLRALPIQYWSLIGQQKMKHPNLPSSEADFTRNDILLEPGWASPQTLYWYFNGYMDWRGSHVGISRFDAETINAKNTVTATAASSGRWGGSGGTLVIGASNVTASATATTMTVEFDLTDYNVAPYLFPMLAQKFLLDGDSTPLASLSIDLVNQQGQTKEIATTFSGTTWIERPVTGDTNYAGDYAQDYGVGFVIVQGADADTDGVSLTTLADTDARHMWELLGGFEAELLRYTLVFATAGGSTTIEYPSFEAPTEAGYVGHITHRQGCHIYPDGPGFRWGEWSWATGATILTNPQAWLFPFRQTAVDAMVARNIIYEAVDKTTNVTTDLASLYDATEGATILDAVNQTQAFMVNKGNDGTILYHNLYRNVPPFSMAPVYRKSSTTLKDYGALTVPRGQDLFGQQVWTHCQRPTRYFMPRAGSHVHPDTASPAWTADFPINIPGWICTQHTRATDDSEGANFVLLDHTGELRASISPWHGAFMVMPLGDGAEKPANTHNPAFYVRAYMRNGDVWVNRANKSLPAFAIERQVTTSGAVVCADIDYIEDTFNRLSLVYWEQT